MMKENLIVSPFSVRFNFFVGRIAYYSRYFLSEYIKVPNFDQYLLSWQLNLSRSFMFHDAH